jgi:hypothetical protein
MEIMEVVWVIVLFWPVFVAVIVSLYSVAIGSEMGEKSSVKLAWLSNFITSTAKPGRN